MSTTAHNVQPSAEPLVILSAFYRPFASGAEQCVEEMVRHANGRKLVIITSRLDRALPKIDHDLETEIIRVGFGYSWDKFLYPFLCLRPVFKLRPRIVHAVMESYAGIGLLLVKWLRSKTITILTLQSGNLDEDKKLKRTILGWLWKNVHTAPDEVTAISKFLADRAIRFRGCAGHVSIIPNGVDLSTIRQAQAERVDKRIVSIARLSPEKGVDVLIRAFAMVHGAWPEAELHLIGDGSERQNLERLVEELGCKERVVFHGKLARPDAMRVLKTGYLFALMSHGEGQGIVLLEAGAANVPSVATRVGGIPEMIEEGKTGFLVDDNDAKTAAERIIRLLQDPALCERMGAAARTFADGYEWEKCIEKYHALWTRLEQTKTRDNILHVLLAAGIYPPAVGGPASYTHAMAKRLREVDVQPMVVTYGDDNTKTEEGWPVHVIDNDHGVLGRYVRYLWRSWRLARRVDVVYLQDPVSEGLPGTIGAHWALKPTVMKIVGDYAWEVYQQTEENRGELLDAFLTHRHRGRVRIIEAIERWTVKRARRVIVPSAYLKTVVERWGVRPGRISVIKNACDPLPRTGTYEEERRTLGIAPEQKIVLTAVRAVPWKGVSELIEWWKDLPQDYVLVVAGDGPELSKWKDLAKKQNLGERIRFLGRIDRQNMARWYRAADLFVLHSGYEGYPHVIAEAVSVGLPCLVSDQGGNPETKSDFPRHVTVLPFRVKDAWVNALTGQSFSRLEPVTGKTVEAMRDETLAVLKDVCAF